MWPFKKKQPEPVQVIPKRYVVVECEKMPSLVGMKIDQLMVDLTVLAYREKERREITPTKITEKGDHTEVETKYLKFLARSL